MKTDLTFNLESGERRLTWSDLVETDQRILSEFQHAAQDYAATHPGFQYRIETDIPTGDTIIQWRTRTT